MVKLGSAVVTRSDGAGPALSRMANIVEQVSQLQAAGREMIIVSSGSVAAGRQILRTQSQLTQAGLYDCEHLPVPSRPMERLPPIRFPKADSAAPVYSPAQCAAVGQSSLMSLYDAMFKVYGMGIGQVLVNAPVLERKEERQSACEVVEGLIDMRMVPVINENDAVPMTSYGGQWQSEKLEIDISDNDAIAAVLARDLKCDLLLLLSNVDSVYTGDPDDEASEPLAVITEQMLDDKVIEFATKSSMGRGGMESKVVAARYAMDGGVKVLIGNGFPHRSILNMIENKDGDTPLGTLFCK